MSFTPNQIVALVKEAKRRASTKTAQHSVRAELVADNLIANNVFPAESRNSVVESLKDHGKTLLLLDKVAQAVNPDTLGVPLKKANHKTASGEPSLVRDSDRAFVQAALYRR